MNKYALILGISNKYHDLEVLSERITEKFIWKNSIMALQIA